MPRFVPLTTPIGTLSGRDAIYLDRVIVSDDCNTLALSGEFNCRLPSKPPSPPAKWQAYELQFSGVLTFQATELDTWESLHGGKYPETSFDEIIDSPWIASMAGKIRPQHRHFVFQTYDRVFEIVCTSYDLQLKQLRG